MKLSFLIFFVFIKRHFDFAKFVGEYLHKLDQII